MKPGRLVSQLLAYYAKHSAFAAGWASQSMLDRESGRLDDACYAQDRAAYYAARAREDQDDIFFLTKREQVIQERAARDDEDRANLLAHIRDE